MKRLTPVAVTIVTLLFAVPAVAGGWPQVGHDAANTGHTASKVTTPVVRNMTETWARTISGTPVVAGAKVYLDPPGNRPLSILSLADGSTVGTIADGRFEGPAAVGGGMVIVQRQLRKAANGSILTRPGIAAFKLSTGKRAWLVGAGNEDDRGRVVAPTIAGGLVFPGGRGKAPARPAVNLKTGRVAYRTAPGGAQGTKIVVGSGMVVAASGNKIRAYRVRNGRFVWQATRTKASLTLLGGRLIVGRGGPLAAYDVVTGKRLWQVPSRTLGGVTVFQNQIVGVVRTSTNTVLRSWSAIDGHTRWEQRIGGAADGFTDPVMTNGVVLLGWWNSTKATLIGARRTSGRRLATLDVGVGRMGAPIVANDTVLVAAGNTLHALRVP